MLQWFEREGHSFQEGRDGDKSFFEFTSSVCEMSQTCR